MTRRVETTHVAQSRLLIDFSGQTYHLRVPQLHLRVSLCNLTPLQVSATMYVCRAYSSNAIDGMTNLLTIDCSTRVLHCLSQASSRFCAWISNSSASSTRPVARSRSAFCGEGHVVGVFTTRGGGGSIK